MFDDLHEIEPGDQISAAQWNMLVQSAKRTFSADHYFEDESGLVVFDQGGAVTDPRHFELKDDLTQGGSATAYPRDWVTDAWTTITDDADREFEVYDELDTFSGDGRDGATAGNWGLAEYSSASGHWEIYQLSCEPGGT